MPRKKKQESEAVIEQPATTPETPAEVDSPMMESDRPSVGQVVVFTMDGQQYALPIEAVQEIQQIVDYTPVPGSVPALVGMIDLRGIVVPLIDLRLLLGLNATPFHLDTPLIFGEAGTVLVAYAVDGVEDVLDLTGVEMQEPSALYALADRLTGVARLADGLLFVLDHRRLIPVDTLKSLELVSDGGAR